LSKSNLATRAALIELAELASKVERGANIAANVCEE
jgi:hypothetical protein